MTSEVTRQTAPRSPTCEVALRTYISDYSVQRVDQDKVKGGWGGRGQTDLHNKEEPIDIMHLFHVQEGHFTNYT